MNNTAKAASCWFFI